MTALKQIVVSICILASMALPIIAQEWPQFRGPDGQGHALAERVPIVWNEQEFIAWKTPIAGMGWSSPVVNETQVWLTTAIEDAGSLRAVCVDRHSGEVLHDIEVFRKADLGRLNAKNSHASPTPVLAGDRVFVHYGAHGTACVSTSGEVLWKTQLEYDHRHGPGGSPVLVGDVLVIACDGADMQYVAGLDADTGETLWTTPREKAEMAYSTPLVIDVDGITQVVSSGGGGVSAYDLRTGQEIWRARYEGHSVIPRPVYAGGELFVCSGYWTPSVYAIRPDGTGDVTATHMKNLIKRGVPFTPSPLVDGNQIYLLSDMGVLTCADLTNGKELWRKRLPGNYSASPTLAEGRLYITSEEGLTTVLATGSKAELLAENQLEGRALASPAFVDGTIYYRSDTHLYAIGGDAANEPPSAALRDRNVERASFEEAD